MNILCEQPESMPEELQPGIILVCFLFSGTSASHMQVELAVAKLHQAIVVI